MHTHCSTPCNTHWNTFAAHCNSLQHTTYQLPSSHNIHTWVAGSSNRHVPSAHPATSRCLHYSLHSAISQLASFQICHKRLMQGSIVLIRLECMYVRVCVRVRVLVSACVDTRWISHIHTRTQTQTQTHSLTHTHTHTHTHPHIHTHTRANLCDMRQCIYLRDEMIQKKKNFQRTWWHLFENKTSSGFYSNLGNTTCILNMRPNFKKPGDFPIWLPLELE